MPASEANREQAVVSLIDGFVDLTKHQVVRGEITHGLTVNEAKLLRYLYERPGQTVSQEVLLAQVFGYRPGTQSRTAANTMRRLRLKIEREPSSPVHLISEYGRGYRFEPIRRKDTPTALFGRDLPFRDLHDLLAAHRAVTLVGPGGIGKSALANAYAAVDPGSLIRCAMGAVTSLDEMDAAVARTLGLREDSGPEALGLALHGRGSVLLMLDGAEGVASTLGPRVQRWLSAAPGSRVLLTSRREVDGVATLALSGLDVEPAEALFLTRSGLDAAAVDRATLEQILTRLAGIPLAIELAAARVGILSLDDLALGSRPLMQLLSSAQTHRHSSMEGALQWSWNALAPVTAEALISCTTFYGAFDIQAAEGVIGGPDPLSSIGELKRSSWLHPDPAGMRILDPLRAFAREQATPAQRTAAHDRHAAHFYEHAQRFSDAAQRGTATAMRALHQLLPDLRQAFEHTIDRAPENAVQLAIIIAPTLREPGRYDPARHLLDRAVLTAKALGLAPAEVSLRLARARLVNARLGPGHALPDAEAAVQQTLVGSQERGRALVVMGILLQQSGYLDRALACLEESLVLLPVEVAGGAEARVNLGQLHLRSRSYEEAEKVLSEVLPVVRRRGYERLLTVALGTLSRLAARRQRWEEAEGHTRDALSNAIESEDAQNISIIRLNLGVMLYGRGRDSEAQEQLEAAQDANARIGSRIGMAHAALNLAIIEVDQGISNLAPARLALAVATFTSASHHGALEAWSTLARMHQTGGHADRAIEVLERALAWESDHPRQHYRLVLLAQRAMALAEQGDLSLARADLNEAQANGLDGDVYQPYLDVAQAFVAAAGVAEVAREDRAAALNHFDACCRLEPAPDDEMPHRFAHSYWTRLHAWRPKL